MRKRLQAWENETGDLGRKPEPADMYDSDMAVYLGARSRRPRAAGDPVSELEQNIELMKRWAAEGE